MRKLRHLGQLTEVERKLPVISLDEEGFSKLLELGYIEQDGIKEPISLEEFNLLTNGYIVVGKSSRIILQDIGFDRISAAIQKSKQTWFR